MPSKWLENYKDNLLTFSSPSQRPKHVHPKLPEYEEFVATFLALKREHAWS
jgi:vacuolar protein sorting-associated protein IST1